jgi:hypothetical protein
MVRVAFGPVLQSPLDVVVASFGKLVDGNRGSLMRSLATIWALQATPGTPEAHADAYQAAIDALPLPATPEVLVTFMRGVLAALAGDGRVSPRQRRAILTEFMSLRGESAVAEAILQAAVPWLLSRPDPDPPSRRLLTHLLELLALREAEIAPGVVALVQPLLDQTQARWDP